MRTGLELGVFDTLAGGRTLSAAQLADALGSNADTDEPVRLLCETLVALGLLDVGPDGFACTPVAERFLVRSSDASMAALATHSPGPPRAWPELAHTIRNGAPSAAITEELLDFYPDLVSATAPTQAAVARAVAAELAVRELWPRRPVVVDFGCGSGAWLASLLADRPEGTAVAVDLPNVLPLARRACAEAGITPNVSTVAGDYLDAELPVRHADVVVLAHVLRAEPAERAQRLLARAIELARPSGVVVIADYPRPDEITAQSCRDARHELLLSLTMLSSTAGIGVRVGDIERWAAASGARLVHGFDAIPRQHVYLVRPVTSEETP
jgi:SAM-dependent methyltransferase